MGPETEDARQYLLEYVQNALKEPNILDEDPRQEALLDAIRTRLKSIRASGEQQVELWDDALHLYREVVRRRWTAVDASGGTIPPPLIIMLILWLTIIFAGFGFGAPRNTIVTASLFLGVLLISAALYLIVDMDTPSTGTIAVSNAPRHRPARRTHPKSEAHELCKIRLNSSSRNLK